VKWTRELQLAKPSATFVLDVNVLDGSIVHCSSAFKKIWRMKNTGSSAWPANTRLRFVGGDKLCDVQDFEVALAQPGEQVNLAVDIVVPNQPGRYCTHFQLFSGDNEFGDRIWIDVYAAPLKVEEEPQQPEPIAPLIPEPEEAPFSVEEAESLMRLSDMGFSNVERNLELLRKHNNDLDLVIQSLLE